MSIVFIRVVFKTTFFLSTLTNKWQVIEKVVEIITKMGKKRENESSISGEVWAQLQTTQIEDSTKVLNEVRKNRRNREFVLLTLCLLAFSYTYPLKDLKNNPQIKVPAISLEIPLKDAIVVFPALIASIYLLILSTGVNESVLSARNSHLKQALHSFKQTGKVPQEIDVGGLSQAARWRYLFLPSPLHLREFVGLSKIGRISRKIVEMFVGTLFTAIPFATATFITIQVWKLLNNKILLGIDILCLLIMVLSCMGPIFSVRWVHRSFKTSDDEFSH